MWAIVCCKGVPGSLQKQVFYLKWAFTNQNLFKEKNHSSCSTHDDVLKSTSVIFETEVPVSYKPFKRIVYE